MGLPGHYARKRPSQPSKNKKNTLAGPQLETCIFRPLRATSVLSPLVSNFHVSQPSRNKKMAHHLKIYFSMFFSKISLPTTPEIKKWLTISKSWLFILIYIFIFSP